MSSESTKRRRKSSNREEKPLALSEHAFEEELDKHTVEIARFIQTPAGKWLWQVLAVEWPRNANENIDGLLSISRELLASLRLSIDVSLDLMAKNNGTSFFEEKQRLMKESRMVPRLDRVLWECLAKDEHQFDRFLSLESVRQITDYGHEALLEFIRSGELHAEKWGEDYRVPLSSLQDFIDSRRKKSTSRPQRPRAKPGNGTRQTRG